MQSYTIAQDGKDAPRLYNGETSPKYLSTAIDAKVNENDIHVYESPDHDCSDATVNEKYIYFSADSIACAP